MENQKPQRPTPVAFWWRKEMLWIEFSDGHVQGFRAAQGEDHQAPGMVHPQIPQNRVETHE